MRVLKTILFHFLYTFRGLVLLVLRFLSGLSLFAFAGTALFGAGVVPWSDKLKMLAFGLGIGALSWYYDALLLKLAPEGVELTLYR